MKEDSSFFSVKLLIQVEKQLIRIKIRGQKLQSSIKYKSQIEGSLNNVLITYNYISGSQNETLGILGNGCKPFS